MYNKKVQICMTECINGFKQSLSLSLYLSDIRVVDYQKSLNFDSCQARVDDTE